jgi:hypothetical protein
LAIVFARVDNILDIRRCLYEAAAFSVCCGIVCRLLEDHDHAITGRVFARRLATGFLARFMIEFVKETQVPFESQLPFEHGDNF